MSLVYNEPPVSEHAKRIGDFIHDLRAIENLALPASVVQWLANQLVEQQLVNCPYPHLPWDKD